MRRALTGTKYAWLRHPDHFTRKAWRAFTALRTIQWIRYTARDYRNRENFKTAIYFHCGRLDLYPH